MTDGRPREEKGWEEGEAFYRRRSLPLSEQPLSLSRTESQEKGGGSRRFFFGGSSPTASRSPHSALQFLPQASPPKPRGCCSIAFIQNHTKERTQLVFVPASVQIGVW